MKRHPNLACVDCEFLTRETRLDGSNTPNVSVLTDQQRTLIRSADYGWLGEHYSLACHRRVWDEGVGLPASRHVVIVETDRTDFCFHWPHHPGMLLGAAIELQKRDADLAKTRTDRRFAAYGLWLAALGLFLNVLARLFENRQWWPFQ